ncbi:MAG TPA: alpha/beta hydrolase [Polyangia bacterium]|nr:alpha/beta hydrolase [Polyangia bacterium]
MKTNTPLWLLSTLLLTASCGPRIGLSFRELHYPVQTQLLDIDHIEVAYSDSGRGDRTLLLIHGLGSYLPVWSRNLDELSQHYRVVAIDLPGYGRSSKANYHYSMRFFARVVERVIEQLRLEHVVLVGHSMGGQIAITHNLLYPNRIDGLILVAPAGLEKFEPGEGGWLADVVTKDFVKLTPLENIYGNLIVNFSSAPREARFMADDRVRIVEGPDFDGYAYAVSRSVRAMIAEPVYDRLPDVGAPTLVVFGGDDALIPNAILHGGDTRQIAQNALRIPRARLVVIPRAGHMVQFEKPELWNRAVVEFLSSMGAKEEPR